MKTCGKLQLCKLWHTYVWVCVITVLVHFNQISWCSPNLTIDVAARQTISAKSRLIDNKLIEERGEGHPMVDTINYIQDGPIPARGATKM